MTTTGHWYINPSGSKADFTDPSSDINFTTMKASVDIRLVRTDLDTGGSDRPIVELWKAAGADITSGEITAAIADQDSASVPDLGNTPDDVPIDALTDPVQLVSPNGHVWQASIADNGTVTWTDTSA